MQCYMKIKKVSFNLESLINWNRIFSKLIIIIFLNLP